jgi:phosphoribosyl 1,2-cyclic phosphate phosphodiesterase
MKITFLGTGTSQGVPVIACECKACLSKDNKDKRLRTSIMVELNGKFIVIDTGPDFRQQMLRADVQQLDAVLFTHAHKDHTAGLDDIRAFNHKQNKEIDIYATKEVQESLSREFSYIFDNSGYPGIPQIKLITINNEPFKIGDILIQPIEVLHYKLPVLGFRIGDFSYITDANYIPEKAMQQLQNSKILVINALRIEKHISHFTLEQAIHVIQKLKPEKAYLIHMSHQIGTHEELSKTLPNNIFLSYDGLVLSLA